MHASLSTSSLYAIEANESRTVRLDTLERLAKAFGLHPLVLLSPHARPRIHWVNGIDFPAVVGLAVVRARQAKGVTQTKLSTDAQVARDIVSKIECGHRSPTLEVMFRLSIALDVDIRDFLV